MKLIKKLGTRIVNGRLESWGLFWCDFCKQEVGRELGSGRKQKSCRCIKNRGNNNPNYKHGDSYSRLHHIWHGIKSRCLNPNNKSFKDYGGRGITICPEWTNDYTNFRDWALDNGYKDSLTIDRKENNGNYCPENCQWISNKENAQKTRRVKLTLNKANEIRALWNTGNYTQKKLAEKYNVDNSLI